MFENPSKINKLFLMKKKPIPYVDAILGLISMTIFIYLFFFEKHTLWVIIILGIISFTVLMFKMFNNYVSGISNKVIINQILFAVILFVIANLMILF